MEYVFHVEHVGEEDLPNLVELLLRLREVASREELDEIGEVVVPVEGNPSDLIV